MHCLHTLLDRNHQVYFRRDKFRRALICFTAYPVSYQAIFVVAKDAVMTNEMLYSQFCKNITVDMGNIGKQAHLSGVIGCHICGLSPTTVIWYMNLIAALIEPAALYLSHIAHAGFARMGARA